MPLDPDLIDRWGVGIQFAGLSWFDITRTCDYPSLSVPLAQPTSSIAPLADSGIDTKVLFGGVVVRGGLRGLQQAQLAGTGDRFGAPLDLQFVEDFPVVPFHRVQGQEEPLANLLIRESLAQ